MYTYTNIVGNGKTLLKGSAGILEAIIINNNTTGGTIDIYDNRDSTGTKIMTIQIGASTDGPVYLGPLSIEILIGLTIVTAGSELNNITVLYREL